MKSKSFAILKSLVPSASWTRESVLKYEDKKSRKDIEFDCICKIPVSKACYLGYTVSFNIFLNQVEWLIADDNISEEAKANYS